MRNCVICTTAAGISDKIKAVVFAKQIAAAEAKRKRNVTIAVVCGAVAVIAVAAAVIAAVVIKKKEIKLSAKSMFENVKSKFIKKDECECACEEALEADEDCECECEFAPEEACEE